MSKQEKVSGEERFYSIMGKIGMAVIYIGLAVVFAGVGFIASISVSESKDPAGTFIFGKQERRITGDALLGDFSDKSILGKMCVIESTYAEALDAGDVVLFSDENNQPKFGEVVRCEDGKVTIRGFSDDADAENISGMLDVVGDDSEICLECEEGYTIDMPASSVRGVVVGTIEEREFDAYVRG